MKIPYHFFILGCITILIMFGCQPTPTPPVTPPAVGDHYQGGIVFYVDSTGEHGFIAVDHDVDTNIVWAPSAQVLTNTFATQTSIGSGQANTDSIVNILGPGNYAAYLCDTLTLNGYTDWFLPSIDELQLLYSAAQPSWGFVHDKYWSSSELSIAVSMAYVYEFPYYGMYGSVKDNTNSLRPIRKF